MEMARAKERLEAVLRGYVTSSEVAEFHRKREHGACIRIQCAWRRRMVYIKLLRWNLAACNIQRVFRGHLGRERFLMIRRNADKALRMRYFNHKATIIQRMYRGYASRKYVHSFCARKAFLADAMSKTAEMKGELSSNYKEQCIARYRAAAKKAEQEVEKFMESSHALLGTEACKGMYYSPYLAVLGKPNQLEDDIREARKLHNNVKEMKEMRRHKKACMPVEVLELRFITSVGPYVTALQKQRAAEKQSRLLQISEEEFRTTLRDRSNPFRGRSLRIQSDFCDHRRVPPDDKRISDKPFFVAVPGGRFFSG